MKKITGLILSTAFIIPHATNADSVIERLSLNSSIGYLTGKAQEFVYVEDYQLSQLDWDIKGSAVIKGEGNFKLLSWLDANAQGWITLAAGNAVMDDYDWLNPMQEQWTDWSHHDNTSLNQANKIDFSLRAWLPSENNTHFAGIIGYQRNLFSFLAKGGCYNYQNGNITGCFPAGEKSLGYKQTFSAPYLGLAGNYVRNAFEFNSVFKYGPDVDAKDTDQHYLRNLTYQDNSQDSEFYNVTLNLGYYIKPQVKLFAEGELNYFPNSKGDMLVRDNDSGEIIYFPNGTSGLSNRSYVVSLGLQYTGANL
ncbi:omptin family outer membrane protease [Legionella dresdenensis]|uniref:Omptin family outer membrane protease n=1 Tax=Legionella dresdenensis TaxID=450200 RepID=A0ABV8CC08_9GAMM